MTNSSEHRSTTRVLDALELIAGGGRNGYTLTEICQRLDAPKSSMFPILHTLCGRGYLTLQADSGRYTTGPSALRLGNAYLENIDALDEITKELQIITAACSETSYFATLKGGNVFYLAKADSPEPIRMVAAIGHSLPAYSTGIGKALLTDCSLPDLKRLYPDGLKPLTSHTITDLQALEEQLVKARKSGFSYESEESTPYICCIAVPLRKGGQIVAAVSVAVPVFRYTEEKAELIRLLLKTAKQRMERLFLDIHLEPDRLG
ncbi:MAG TPA: IclR family transcriptional regulator [Candidatus Eisenbergiella merdipullorum]|uniref:IclR family transcriptional regulator n=1 Tax=Candidatus Eisenbergiella merdipullorum TaxID=2838553 RepID=A0A9D2I4E4_9FIRM|nr:IclR family transcriptional regulator [Candidatus Eisenbergiella merdipullorum]